MPESLSFTVTTHRKLAKGETGLTTIASKRLCLADAAMWVLDNLPEDAFRIVFLDAEGNELPEEVESSEYCRVDFDWTRVPDYMRDPILPRRRT